MIRILVIFALAVSSSAIADFIPDNVTLTENASIPLMHSGRTVGNMAISAGTKVKVISIENENIEIETAGSRAKILIQKTNYLALKQIEEKRLEQEKKTQREEARRKKENNDRLLSEQVSAERKKTETENRRRQDAERQSLLESAFKVGAAAIVTVIAIVLIYRVSSMLSSNEHAVGGMRILPFIMSAIFFGFFHVVFYDGFPGVTLVPKTSFGYSMSIISADEVIRLWNSRKISDALKGDPILDNLVRELERKEILKRDEQNVDSFRREMQRQIRQLQY